jgi:hypothetical protein
MADSCFGRIHFARNRVAVRRGRRRQPAQITRRTKRQAGAVSDCYRVSQIDEFLTRDGVTVNLKQAKKCAERKPED